jgi:hypothetical protein
VSDLGHFYYGRTIAEAIAAAAEAVHAENHQDTLAAPAA